VAVLSHLPAGEAVVGHANRCADRRSDWRVNVVSTMRQGDEDFHYSDNSHRWIAPHGIDQDVWESMMRAHLGQHLLTMDIPAQSIAQPPCRPPHIPRQRRASEQVGRPTARVR
jgi:hypothetical protein